MSLYTHSYTLSVLIRTFYRGCDGIMVTYAVDDANSFTHITNWIKDLPADVLTMVIANKIDLPKNKHIISENKVRRCVCFCILCMCMYVYVCMYVCMYVMFLSG